MLVSREYFKCLDFVWLESEQVLWSLIGD